MSQEKHWNYTKDIVRTSISGVCAANPYLKYIESERVVYNSHSPENGEEKVTVVSGGGSGHEPLHLGFVGDALLDVAVAGSIFASPSVKQVLSGIHSKPSKKGTVVVVKNYTGDILHFGLAIERARSQGINAGLLIVQDDVSVGKTKNGKVGRRGLAGTALVHKLVGAKSFVDGCKASLDDVMDLGQRVIDNMVTIGASLDRVVIPTVHGEEKQDDSDDEDEKIDELGKDEIEIGMGIHNEHGIKRVSPIPTVDQLAETLLAYLLDPNDEERYYVDFDKDDDVVLLINNLGSTSVLELYAIQAIVNEKLFSIYNIKPVRIYTGTFVTSLDGPGISITLLNVTKAGGDEILRLLDLPTNAPGWNSAIQSSDWKKLGEQLVKEAPEIHYATSSIKLDPELVKKILLKGCEEVKKVEPKVTLYDTVAGDGDCGETLLAGADSITNSLRDNSIDLTDAVRFFEELGDVVESAMGGTSGGLYSIFISSMSSFLKQQEKSRGAFTVSEEDFADTLEAGLKGLQRYTRARVGDRTLMDALIPFVETFKSTGDINKAAQAAHDGAESTRKLAAKFGRASYVAEEEFRRFDSEGGLPDPGAIGLAALINGFVSAYQS